MNSALNIKEKSLLERILDQKALILVILGFSLRIGMLIVYYIEDIISPMFGWGDTGRNFKISDSYPPLSYYFIAVFRFLSFGSVHIFIFWAFLWEIFGCILFYFVLKSFNIKSLNYAYGLFLLNPFFFLNLVFGVNRCGYQFTDSFFYFLFFLALYFLPKKESHNQFFFYLFLGLSMCAKYYTLPALGFFILKFILERDWDQLIRCLVGIIPLVLGLLFLPIFFLDWYYAQTTSWVSSGSITPVYIRIIPSAIIAIIFVIFRLRKADGLEIVTISIIGSAAFLFMTLHYVEWFVPVIFYGILKEKEFFTIELNFRFIKREVNVNNTLLTFYLSFIGVFLSFLFIITGFNDMKI